MKANELMIGDWVRHADGTHCCVVSKIELGKGFACRIGNSQYLWDYNNKFEPIPLTEEILKANGFFWNDNEKIHVLGNPSKYFIIDNNLETSIGVGYIIKINHVHELQHALRLCGLNDIADNFKLVTT